MAEGAFGALACEGGIIDSGRGVFFLGMSKGISHHVAL